MTVWLGILLIMASSFGFGVLVTLWFMYGLDRDAGVDYITGRPYGSTVYPRETVTYGPGYDDAGNALDPKHG